MHKMVCATINIDTTKHLNIIIFLGTVEFPQIIVDLGIILDHIPDTHTIVDLCIILDHINIITDLHTNIVAALDIIADINPIIHLDIAMDLYIIVCINIAAHLGLMRQEHIDTDPIVLVQDITVIDNLRMRIVFRDVAQLGEF